MNFMIEVFYFFRRHLFCRFNIHFHPEHDGLYLGGLSHGRCYACDVFIKKEENGKWVKANEE